MQSNSQPNVGAVKKTPMSSGAPADEPMSNQTRSQIGVPKRSGSSVPGNDAKIRPFGSAATLIAKGKR